MLAVSHESVTLTKLLLLICEESILCRPPTSCYRYGRSEISYRNYARKSVREVATYARE